MWRCQCHCGNIFTVRQWDLRHGKVVSCGCLRSSLISKKRSYDLIGRTFNRLTVIERVGSNKWRKALWKCRCSCGKETVAPTDALVWNQIQSCGCLLTESITTHGLTHTKEYNRSKSNRRRERRELYDSRWTPEMEFQLRSLFKSCVVCGSTKKLSTGHLYSLSSGHGLVPGNAIVLCTSCNSKQWTYPPDNLPDSLPVEAGAKMTLAAQDFKTYWESINSSTEVLLPNSRNHL